MPVVDLCGAPRERGRGYGEAVRESIADVLDRWRGALGSTGSRETLRAPFDPDAYLDGFLHRTDFLPAIQQWAPALLEEVEGIAEGAGQSRRTMLALQLLDEEWEYGLRRGLERPVMRCTSFAIAGAADAPTLAGQNMDVPAWVDGCQVLLRIKGRDGEPDALVFSIAGYLGFNGMTGSPLGITCNSLSQLRSSCSGLPVSFLVRSILARRTIDDAERFLRSIRHASAQAYTLSAPGDVRCFECSARRVDRYASDAAPARLLHTNHPFVNRDWDEGSAAERVDANSEARLASVRRHLGQEGGAMTVDQAKAALAARDECENPVSCRRRCDDITGTANFTAGASIYEMSDSPRLHFAAGPPCQTAFKVFT